jgi:hypothetical protein
MFMLFWAVVAVLGAIVQFAVRRRRGRDTDVAALVLNWFLLVVIGVAGLIVVVAHTAFAGVTADGIGFPSGNPFQYEVAVANFAIAVIAFVAVRVQGAFRTAAGLAGGLWYAGDAIVHVYELVAHGNHAPNNSGVFLVTEIIIGLLLLALAAYTATEGRSGVAVRTRPVQQT